MQKFVKQRDDWWAADSPFPGAPVDKKGGDDGPIDSLAKIPVPAYLWLLTTSRVSLPSGRSPSWVSHGVSARRRRETLTSTQVAADLHRRRDRSRRAAHGGDRRAAHGVSGPAFILLFLGRDRARPARGRRGRR